MKTKILALGFFAALLFISCSKDNEKTTVSSSDIADNAKIDNIGDDVAQIVESQSNETAEGRYTNLASGCLTVTTTQDGDTYTRTLNYGDTNCTLSNGNRVRGKIIIVFQNDFVAETRTLHFSFVNFYHNDRHVEGDRTVVKTRLENGNIKADIDLNMTITLPDGRVFTRTGHRVRVYNLTTNEFSVTGSWTTTNSNGASHTNTIDAETPLRIIYCTNQLDNENHYEIVSGIITVVNNNNNNTAVIDYGNGVCDNTGTITINSGSPITFNLRN